jgi:uncharacterized protein
MRKVLIFLLAWNATPWMVVGAIVAPAVPGGWVTIAAVGLLLFLPVLVLIRGFSGEAYPPAAVRVWVLRPFWYTQLFLPLLGIAGILGVLVGLPFGSSVEFGRVAIAAAAALLLAVSIAGYLGTRRLVVWPLDVGFDDLPEDLGGLRIVQLSDLHVGPQTSKRHLKRIAEAVRDARPHLIVLTGDQVDDFAGDIEHLAAALGRLTAPLGVIAVAGNHDVYAGWRSVREGMERIGWKVLVNEAIALDWKQARFWVAGIGDPAGYGGPTGRNPTVVPDIEGTLAPIPEGAFTLALAHNPALWPALAEHGVHLTLSGHTHYGQLAVPHLGWSLASAFLEHAMGTHRDGDSVLYINPGTNFWGIPLRIGTPPEVTLVTLHRSSSDDLPLGAGRAGLSATSGC